MSLDFALPSTISLTAIAVARPISRTALNEGLSVSLTTEAGRLHAAR